MNELVILNPDDFLGTPRVWTPERNRAAWEEIHTVLEHACAQASAPTTLYLVCGIQGSGKSTFIRDNPDFFAGRALVIDAALPAASHRQRALGIALRHGVPAVAIWLDTPLALALARNHLRPPDQRVPPENIAHVHTLMQPPSRDEGFSQIHHLPAPVTA